MNKDTKKVKKPLSDKAKTSIWISVIAIVAIAVLVVSLILVLKPEDITTENETPGTSGSSSLTIPNGDFLYTTSEKTGYPLVAQDWTLHKYQAPTSSSVHNFGTVSADDANLVMGIVNTTPAVWNEKVSALQADFANIKNPGTHDNNTIIDKKAVEEGEHDVANVYMIGAKELANASIMSKSFSIASMASAKITVWVNTAQVTSGNAIVMLQNSAGTALQKSVSGTQYWYAYDFAIDKTVETTDNGWEKHEFQIFNRSSSYKTVKCNVGLGNVYNDEKAQGVMFVDDIQFETVTANDYREFQYNASAGNNGYIIKPTAKDDATVDILNWDNATELGDVNAYLNEEAAKVDGKAYSPFVLTDEVKEDNFKIYKSENGGISLTKDITKDGPEYVHFYFWMRVVEGTSDLSYANVVDIIVNDEKGEELTSIKEITAVEDITKDTNCGWQQYHVYVRPDEDATTAQVTLEINWSNTGVTDYGTIYIGQPSYEIITDKQYSSASTGATSVKADMSKTSASTSVTNGSFSNLADANKEQPASWTHVFAGENAIYKDGKVDTDVVNKTATAIQGSGVVTTQVGAPEMEDAFKYYLAVANNQATSHGYLSQSITLSAKTIYQISVLAKVEGEANPYIYIVDNDNKREEAVIASFTSKKANTDMDELMQEPVQKAESGWVRYYFIIETGEESLTVNVALFNGSIDGAVTTTGTVYYDQVVLRTIGSYTVGEDTENEDAAKYKVDYTSGNAAYDWFEDKFVSVDGNAEGVAKATFSQENATFVSLADWDEMRTIPEEVEEEEVEEEEEVIEEEEENKIDVALLLSVISSVALVAALLIVVVIKMFKRKKS